MRSYLKKPKWERTTHTHTPSTWNSSICKQSIPSTSAPANKPPTLKTPALSQRLIWPLLPPERAATLKLGEGYFSQALKPTADLVKPPSPHPDLINFIPFIPAQCDLLWENQVRVGNNPLNHFPLDEADDDDDPEYNFLEDLDEPDTEDFRTDRAVRITSMFVSYCLFHLSLFSI